MWVAPQIEDKRRGEQPRRRRTHVASVSQRHSPHQWWPIIKIDQNVAMNITITITMVDTLKKQQKNDDIVILWYNDIVYTSLLILWNS